VRRVSTTAAGASGQLLRAKDVALLLGVHVKTVYSWTTAGILPSPIRIGRGIRFRLDDITSWVSARREG